MLTKLIWAGAAALVLSPVAANANPFASPRAVVKTSDLDLSSRDGVSRLEARIARAATDVCGMSVSHLGAAVTTQAHQCRADVTTELRTRLGLNDRPVTLASAN